MKSLREYINLFEEPRDPAVPPPIDPARVVVDPTARSQSNRSILALGSSGPAVEELQKKLNDGGEKLDVDGKFGPATRQAVVNLQKKLNVDSDGAYGPITRAAHEKMSPTAVTPSQDAQPTTPPAPTTQVPNQSDAETNRLAAAGRQGPTVSTPASTPVDTSAGGFQAADAAATAALPGTRGDQLGQTIRDIQNRAGRTADQAVNYATNDVPRIARDTVRGARNFVNDLRTGYNRERPNTPESQTNESIRHEDDVLLAKMLNIARLR